MSLTDPFSGRARPPQPNADAVRAAEQAVLRFVRGELPLAELEKSGIFVELKPEGCQVDNPWKVSVTASPKDVAQGVLRLRHTASILQDWAAVVLGASGVIDFDVEFETNPLADTLKGVLWDLAFHQPLTSKAVAVATKLSEVAE